MCLLLRTLLLTGWLCSLVMANLRAQPSAVSPNRQRGLELVHLAQTAYRQNDVRQAMSLVEKATPLLDFGEEAFIWCMVLRMHPASEMLAASVPRGRQNPTIAEAETKFLAEQTPRHASELLYSYMWASHQLSGMGNGLSVISSMGWTSVAFCLANRYDSVWQPVVQYKLFSGIEGLAKQILPAKEVGLSGNERAGLGKEREALYALFGQIGISTGRAMLSQATSDNKPANWEDANKKVVALYGADSPEAAIILKTISNLYQANGDTKTAEIKLHQAILLLKRLPEQRTKLLACYMDMALLSLQMRRYDLVTEALRNAYPLLTSQNQLNMSMSVSGRRKEVYALANNDMRSLLAFAASVGQQQNDPVLQGIAYDAMLYLNGLLLDDSRQMRATLYQKLAQTNDPILRQRHADWLAKREAFLNGPDSQRETLGEAVAAAETQLLTALNPESSRITNRTDLNWKQVQARLQPDEAAVSFVRFVAVSGKGYSRFPLPLPSTDTAGPQNEWFYAAMVVRPNEAHPRFTLLCSETQLANLIQKAKTPVALYGNQRGPGFKNVTYGDSLYQFVWKPIEAGVTGARSVYISTEGLISQVALAALPLPNVPRNAPARERYLSSRHNLNMVFGMRQVARQIQPLRLSGQPYIALLGGIDYQQATDEAVANPTGRTYLQESIADRQLIPLKPLPGTGPEVAAIAALLPNHSLLRSHNATEGHFRQLMNKAPTLLHVATHGLYLPYRQNSKENDEALVISDDAMTRSALALAGANRLWRANEPIGADHDGLLTAYEIADLDLSRTRLAVLSACETGLGDVGLFASSEGLLGLQRGFRLAGVEKMMLSLWAVDDQATKQFMTAFYTYLKAGSDVREAFRKAQSDLQTTDDPTLWAAFVLIE